MSLPGTYEMFGIDWAIDNNNKGWILEVNPEPSMLLFRHMEGGRAQMIGGGPFGEPLEIGSVKDGGGLPEGWQKVSDYFFQTSYSYSFFSRRRERERERERPFKIFSNIVVYLLSRAHGVALLIVEVKNLSAGFIFSPSCTSRGHDL